MRIICQFLVEGEFFAGAYLKFIRAKTSSPLNYCCILLLVNSFRLLSRSLESFMDSFIRSQPLLLLLIMLYQQLWTVLFMLYQQLLSLLFILSQSLSTHS
jgi:hypothetical protein